jgi:F-type H+-transporting ATPase subunit delta
VAVRSPSARRYAEAVFQLAREGDAFVRWSGDVETVAGFVGEPDVLRVLTSSKVPREEKERLLTAALSDSVSAQAMNLVRLLLDANKLQLAPEIREIFQEMADEQRGVAHATVTTAVELSDDERRAIASRLSEITGKQVEVKTMVDESIIGGLVARIGDQLIDGSTRSRLLALRRSMETGARR